MPKGCNFCPSRTYSAIPYSLSLSYIIHPAIQCYYLHYFFHLIFPYFWFLKVLKDIEKGLLCMIINAFSKQDPTCQSCSDKKINLNLTKICSQYYIFHFTNHNSQVPFQIKVIYKELLRKRILAHFFKSDF